MAKKKTKDVDLLAAIVGVVVFAAMAYPQQSNLASFLLWAAVVGIVIFVVALLLALVIRKNIQKRKHPQTKLTADPWTYPFPAKISTKQKAESNLCQPALSPTLNAWNLELLNALEWKQFENLCANYFKAKGRSVQLTTNGADAGVDLFLYGRSGENGNPLGVVQCKSWGNRYVGVKHIRELLGVMTDVGCSLGVFITTSSYTNDAYQFAKGKHIKLIDGRKFLTLIQSLPNKQQQELLLLATSGDYCTPSCPSCGIKLLRRTSRQGKNAGSTFWGCRNYPACRYTMK